MKNLKLLFLSIVMATLTTSCSDDDDNAIIDQGPDFLGIFAQKDQMARPAINTVFVSSGSKDTFNVTIPTNQNANFQSMFETNLLGLSPAYADGGLNALGQDVTAFTGLLATDVLNVSLDGTTTFFDGTNLLTGRNLTDDVITVELILIFGGEEGLTNPEFPGLSNDNVDANDKEFLNSFPYLASPW
jgi:hypothetical protein